MAILTLPPAARLLLAAVPSPETLWRLGSRSKPAGFSDTVPTQPVVHRVRAGTGAAPSSRQVQATDHLDKARQARHRDILGRRVALMSVWEGRRGKHQGLAASQASLSPTNRKGEVTRGAS
jgi:hypothetical protein